MKYEFAIKGMSCAGCSARVEKAVSALENVSECSVSLLTNSMIVETEGTPDEIVRAVKEAGFRAKKNNSYRQDSIEEDIIHQEKFTRKLLARRLITSVILTIPLMILCFSGKRPYIQMLLALAVMVVNGRFFINGFNGVIHHHPNMDTLVSMGSAVSFVYSAVLLLSGKTNEHLFFDSSGMILTLITVGKLLEAISKGRTTNAIKSLKALAPSCAFIIRNGKELTVPIKEVSVGDIFVVKSGESFPVDGKVIEGTAMVDESAMTGESVLLDKRKDSEVYTSTIVKSGELRCVATCVGEDTFLAKVIDMVTRASSTKAPIAGTADKVAGIFVPSILGLSLLVFLIWILIGHNGETDLSFAIERAVSVMVVSCPCAMGLATPVAIMVGNGVAAGKGILFKNARALEEAGKTDIVVLDKTGTLTKGNLEAGDSLKEDSAEAVAALKNMGLRLVMLTGDHEDRAKIIAKEAGIDEVVANVLPQGKEKVVTDYKKEGKVMMVGDGINDAVALTVADVGVAIGSGKDIAIDSADVILMNNSLTDLTKMIDISKKTLVRIKMNLGFAFIYNVILIPIAAGAFSFLGVTIGPIWCALAMSLSSFTVVSNSLFIRRKVI